MLSTSNVLPKFKPALAVKSSAAYLTLAPAENSFVLRVISAFAPTVIASSVASTSPPTDLFSSVRTSFVYTEAVTGAIVPLSLRERRSLSVC